MARRTFGGTAADFLTDSRGNVESGGTGTVWTARTGGTQITDLLDANGAAVTTVSALASPEGMVLFSGPDDGTSVVWVDFGGGRVKMVAHDGYPALDNGGDIAAAAVPDLSGIYAPLTSGGKGVVRQDSLAFNVKDYGAEGDGSTDDTAAIQAAINAASVAGGTVFFPAGTYCISSQLTVSAASSSIPPAGADGIQFSEVSVVHFTSAGLATIKATAAMSAMVRYTFDAPDSDPAPHFSSIVGLGFDGNDLATSGLYFEWTIHTRVEGNRFWNLTNGITIEGFGVSTITSNAFLCSRGVNILNGGDNHIEHNDFFFPGANSYGIYCGYWSGNTTVVGNVFSRESVVGTLYALYLDGASSPESEEIRNLCVRGNEFHGMTAGVYANPDASARNIYACSITDNHLILSSAANSTLANLTKCDDFIITGNWIGRWQESDGTAAGIILSDCQRTVIQGNQFTRFSSSALTMAGCQDTLISGNTFNDCGKGGATTPIIYVSGSNFRAVIVENKFIQFSAAYGQVGVEEAVGTGSVIAQRNTFVTVGQPYKRSNSSMMRSEDYGTSAPASGTYNVGDLRWNTSPTAGGTMGWVCTTAGSPGTWKTFGAITA